MNHELSMPRLSAGARAMHTADAVVSPLARRQEVVTPSLRQADATWDPLMICIAGYILVAVGRVHQLFPAIAITDRA